MLREMEKCCGRKGSEGECRQNKRYAVNNWEEKYCFESGYF